MDIVKYTEFLNYFLNDDKKYPERIYNLSPKKRVLWADLVQFILVYTLYKSFFLKILLSRVF